MLTIVYKFNQLFALVIYSKVHFIHIEPERIAEIFLIPQRRPITSLERVISSPRHVIDHTTARASPE